MRNAREIIQQALTAFEKKYHKTITNYSFDESKHFPSILISIFADGKHYTLLAVCDSYRLKSVLQVKNLFKPYNWLINGQPQQNMIQIA